MTWKVGEFLIANVPVPASGNISIYSDRYAARFCVKDDISCVEFIMYNVTRGQSGKVTCTVLGTYGSKTADLYVQAVNSSLYNTTGINDVNYFNSTSVLKFQAVSDTRVECLATVPALKNPQSSSVHLVVVPKPPDWTVLIAVVLSFSCAALLALLIIGIVFCYKRRKEKRVAPSQNTDSGFSQANGSHVYEAQQSKGCGEIGDIEPPLERERQERGIVWGRCANAWRVIPMHIRTGLVMQAPTVSRQKESEGEWEGVEGGDDDLGTIEGRKDERRMRIHFLCLHERVSASCCPVDEKKNNLPEDFDIDMENPETEKAAVAIQSQFRKFQKKKQDVKS
ncbi:Calmodulin regulator protein PCP4 [Nibea albiflora]|uniref:Calmodulin regulator protein PCP4 n=1 Tax=Nibea albiflora TaxID=240163 RepID=A0ACB7F2E3_NIBAL|nr:Calmodulin regulator protein PCP4 [Nibea albiflora]